MDAMLLHRTRSPQSLTGRMWWLETHALFACGRAVLSSVGTFQRFPAAAGDVFERPRNSCR